MSAPFSRLRRSLARQRGATVTEKLVVILMGLMIIVPAIAFLGPMLQQKFEFVNTMLGGQPHVETLANRPVEQESSNIGLYVLVFVTMLGGFFAVFVAPLLFPRARMTRQDVINFMAEKLPFLEPLADWHAQGMEELYKLNEELKAQPKDGALQIKSRDLGAQADPNEMTAPRDALKAPEAAAYLYDQPPMASPPPAEASPLNELPEMPTVGGGTDDSATLDWQADQVSDLRRQLHEQGPLHTRPSMDQDDPDVSLLTSIPIEQVDPKGERNVSSQRLLPRRGSSHNAPNTGANPAVPITGANPAVPNTGANPAVHRPITGANPAIPNHGSSSGYPIDPIDPDATLARDIQRPNLPQLDRIVPTDDDETTVNAAADTLRGTIKDGRDADDPDATTNPSQRTYPRDPK